MLVIVCPIWGKIVCLAIIMIITIMEKYVKTLQIGLDSMR
jgi:hypothetical protein